MFDAEKLSGSVDLIARYDKTEQILMLTRDEGCGCGGKKTLTFRGHLGRYGFKETIPVVVSIPTDQLDAITVKEQSLKSGGTEITFHDSKGKKAKPSYRVTQCNDPSGKYEAYLGQCDNGDGVVIDVFIVTDPPPVIVVVAGLAAICLLIKKIDEWTTDCDRTLATTIAACVAAGGIPVYHIDGTVVISFSPSFEIGCEAHCIWDRCEAPPKTAPTSSSSTTTTTTTQPNGTTTTTTTTTTNTKGVMADEEDEGDEKIGGFQVLNEPVCGGPFSVRGFAEAGTAKDACRLAKKYALAGAKHMCPLSCPDEVLRSWVPFTPTENSKGKWECYGIAHFECPPG